jgi:hypothetical protein
LDCAAAKYWPLFATKPVTLAAGRKAEHDRTRKSSATSFAFSRSSKRRSCGSRAGPSTTPTTCERAATAVKVGGHQASSASLATIMTALYFRALRPAGSGRRSSRMRARSITPSNICSAAEPAEARGLSRLQGRPKLSLAHQGHRRRGFLHGLGRARGRADAVLLAGAGLCPRHGWGWSDPKAA